MSNAGSMKGVKKKSIRSDHGKELKVKYISSPMKFKASASEFRALVQELTGQDSDAERFVELNTVHKSSSTPTQQWKNGADQFSPEVPALNLPYPCNHSYEYSSQQGSDHHSLLDAIHQGFHFDMNMMSFGSMQSL